MKYTLPFLLALLLLGCGDDVKDGSGNDDSDNSTDSNSDNGNDSDSNSDDDTNSGSDNDSDSNTDTNIEECADIDWEVELNTVNILVLLDRSKSMQDWQMGTDTYAAVVQQAVEYIVEQNTNAGTINFALNAFPSNVACPAITETDTEQPGLSGQCSPSSQFFSDTPEVSDEPLVAFSRDTEGELIVSSDTFTMIQDQLSTIGQCGGTPAAASLEWALYYLQQAESMPPEDTYVILATDGAPNCNADHPTDTDVCTKVDPTVPVPVAQNCLDDTAAYDAARALRAAGYRTFVIGVNDASNQEDTDAAMMFDEVMNGLAYFGAAPTPEDNVPTSTEPYYYSAADPASLDAALEEITNEVVDCEYAVDWIGVPDEFQGMPVDKNCSDVRLLGVDAITGDEIEVGYTENCAFIEEGALAWYWVESPGASFEEIEAMGNDYTQCSNISLCPVVCDKLKAKGGSPSEWSGISAKFGCEPEVIPIVPE